QVFVNNEQKTPVYYTPDFTITTTGIAMTLDIPAIQAQVTFKGMNFVINLPFSLFHNNTVGQCGKCDNNTITDCVMPDGKLSNSCTDMAPKWQVNDTLCPNPPPTPSPPTTPPPTCKPPICDVIFSKVFENCHKVINPKVFYEACVYDVCLMRNSTGCFSLQSYAQMCASENICVDWRGSTNGQCAPNCPPNKVYNACGPKMEKTCNSMVNDKLINCNSSVCQDSFREGCFCPNGTTLFSASTDVCTAFCGCTGPDGKPKQPGEKWVSECNECTCSQTSMGPVCTAVKCSSPEVCTKVGYKLQTVDCCPKCVCNTSMCPTTIPQCSPGYELVQNKTDSDCCVSFSCKPKQVCVYGGKEYMPGEKVKKDSCEDCVCGPTMNQDSKLLDVKCTPMHCNTTCS
ncbi:mucin-2-like, partial [Silurus meridionalis]